MRTVCLTGEEIARHVDIVDVIDAVEDALGAYARGNAQMPAKSYIDLPQYNGDFRSMPAYVSTNAWEAATVKWVNVHPDNPSNSSLPTVMGTVVYSDPETGFPRCIMDGTELTMLRTGAAAAVATKYLAVDDATSLGIIGAGRQAYTQLEAIATVRDIDTVVVSDVDADAVDAFVDRYEDSFAVRRGSTAEASGCDVVSTLTPVRSPIVSADDVGAHTHINAMGADAEGKQELSSTIHADATLVIDDHEQTTHSGEINVSWSEGAITDSDIHATIGEIISGSADGRSPSDGVTVFDSTGLAIQDTAAAHVAFESAVAASAGKSLSFVPHGE